MNLTFGKWLVIILLTAITLVSYLHGELEIALISAIVAPIVAALVFDKLRRRRSR